jgi:hypothetical protein
MGEYQAQPGSNVTEVKDKDGRVVGQGLGV